MRMTEKDYRQKIRKLLSLAESPNENEARAALLKARQLMAEHNIRLRDLQDAGSRKVRREGVDGISFSKMINPWALIGTLNDTGAFVDSLEDLMDKAGPQLDSGAAASMKALSQTLRSLAKTMDATGSIRSAKDAVTDIVEDVWDEYAGETSNLLNMDPNAPKESLTDSRNPEPETLQVLLRTQEIKAEEKQGGASAEETAKTETNAEEKSNLWTRFSDLFKGMFAAVIGLFR